MADLVSKPSPVAWSALIAPIVSESDVFGVKTNAASREPSTSASSKEGSHVRVTKALLASLTKKGKVDGAVFKSATINTPFILAVEDYIDALQWTDSIGGVPALIKMSQDNLGVLDKFVTKNGWI